MQVSNVLVMGAETIDHWDPAPVYQQLAAILRGRIERGDLAPRQVLPSETALVQEHGVSRGTVRRAMEMLRSEGWVRTFAQRGTFVADEEDWPRPEG